MPNGVDGDVKKITITITAELHPQGIKMHIDVQPTTTYPDFVEDMCLRAGRWYGRKIQASEVLTTTIAHQAAQRELNKFPGIIRP